MLNNIILIVIFFLGIGSVAYATIWINSAYQLHKLRGDSHIDRAMTDSQVYGSILLMFSGIVAMLCLYWFIVGRHSDQIIMYGVLGMSLIQLAASVISSRVVVGHPHIEKGRVTYLISIITAVVVGMTMRSAYISSRGLPPSPFQYDPLSAEVDPMYCRGEMLIVRFAAQRTQRPENLRISGRLLKVSLSSNGISRLAPVELYQFDVLDRSELQTGRVNGVFDEFRLLDVGTFRWEHSSRAIDSAGNYISEPSSFITEPFEVIDCSE